jgi:hypothetical protein
MAIVSAKNDFFQQIQTAAAFFTLAHWQLNSTGTKGEL